MLINSFKVSAATTDITNMVMGMTFFESINGMLQGTIQMLDGQNFFDQVIGYHDQLVPVNIEFTVLSQPFSMIFMIDGINQMKIFKSEKSYIMHLISTEEFNLRVNDVNAVFNSTAEEVVKGIYEGNVGDGNKLIINSMSTTKGKYIVPNIPAIEAIANATYVAIDAERTGFYFYQRLWDEGTCRFASLYTMSRDFHKNLLGKRLVIENRDTTLTDLDDGNITPEGAASVFELDEYRMDHTIKLQRGEFGHKIHDIELDKTNLKKNEALVGGSAIVTTRHKISEFIYGRPITIPPGPHSDEEPETYEQKSLFHDVDSPNTQAAINLRKRIYNNTISVSAMNPSPYLGCGQSVELKLGGANISYSVSDGPYIISDINHVFQNTDTGMQYVQNVKLLREYA